MDLVQEKINISTKLINSNVSCKEEIELLLKSDDFDLSHFRYVKATMSRIGKERDYPCLETGRKINPSRQEIFVSLKLHKDTPSGLYSIDVLEISGEVKSIKNEIRLLVYIHGSNIYKPVNTHQKYKELKQQQYEFMNYEIITDENLEIEKHYEVVVFCTGAIINEEQFLRGYRIKPYSTDYSLSNIENSLSAIDKDLMLSEDFSKELKASLIRDTPQFYIIFPNVISSSHEDANNYCLDRVRDIAKVITYEKGSPVEITMAVSAHHGRSDDIKIKVFRKIHGGNLASIDKTSTSKFLDRMLDRCDSSEWLSFLSEIYSDLICENKLGASVYKAWSILEAISKKHIQDSQVLLNRKGDAIAQKNSTKPRMTKIGRNTLNGNVVYFYLANLERNNYTFTQINGMKIVIEGSLNSSSFEPDDDGKYIYLIDFVDAIYKIRNHVAHEGKFTSMPDSGDELQALAELLYNLDYGWLKNHLESLVKELIMLEFGGGNIGSLSIETQEDYNIVLTD